MYSKLGRSITNDEFDFRIKDSEFLRIDDYIDSKTSIRFKCKSCGRIYKKPPKAFSTLTCKCLDNKNNYLNSLVSKNITILEPYINAKTKIEHQCNNCGLTFRIASTCSCSPLTT